MNTLTAFGLGAAAYAAAAFGAYVTGLDIKARQALRRWRLKARQAKKRWAAKPHNHPAYWTICTYDTVRDCGYLAVQWTFRPRRTLALWRTIRSLPPYQQSDELTSAVAEAVRLHTSFTDPSVTKVNFPVRREIAFAGALIINSSGSPRTDPESGYTCDTSLTTFIHADGTRTGVTLGGGWGREVEATPERKASRDRVKAALAAYVPTKDIAYVTVRLDRR